MYLYWCYFLLLFQTIEEMTSEEWQMLLNNILGVLQISCGFLENGCLALTQML